MLGDRDQTKTTPKVFVPQCIYNGVKPVTARRRYKFTTAPRLTLKDRGQDHGPITVGL